MSKLPEDWLFETFDKIDIQVIDGDRGNNYPKQNEFAEEGFCLFLSAKNVTKRGFEFNEKQFINEEKDSLLRKGKLTRGDLILTTRGTVGNVAYYNESVKYDHLRINSGMVLLRTPENVDNLYLYKVMTSNFIQDKIKNISFGSAQPQLTVKEIKRFKIPLPPLEEQKKIADILSTVDQKIAFVEDNISQTQELKKGLMQKLLTQGIGHTEFKDSEIGRIPEVWKVVQQSEVASFYNGRAYKLSEWEEKGTPVIRLQNLTGSGLEYYYSTLELPEHQYCEKGDLLYMWSATFGPVWWFGEKAIYHYHIWKITTEKNKLDKNFLYYLLDQITMRMKRQSHGSTMIHVTKGGMEKLKIQLPPLEEQKQIAEILSAVDQKLEVLKEKKESFEELKKGLMQKLLTGEVRV